MVRTLSLGILQSRVACHTCNYCLLFTPQVFTSLQNLEENGNVTKDSLSLDIFNTKEMVSAMNEYSQILYLRAKFLKVVMLRLYGCEETSLETNPMDKKKKAISESHFAHARNKCN